jgi:hypothetical protein
MTFELKDGFTEEGSKKLDNLPTILAFLIKRKIFY